MFKFEHPRSDTRFYLWLRAIIHSSHLCHVLGTPRCAFLSRVRLPPKTVVSSTQTRFPRKELPRKTLPFPPNLRFFFFLHQSLRSPASQTAACRLLNLRAYYPSSSQSFIPAFLPSSRPSATMSSPRATSSQAAGSKVNAYDPTASTSDVSASTYSASGVTMGAPLEESQFGRAAQWPTAVYFLRIHDTSSEAES